MPEFVFDAIGTGWSIRTDSALATATTARLLETAEEFDRTYSRFRPDSLVTTLTQGAGSFEFPSDAKPLLDFYTVLHGLTGGAVNPLVGSALEHLGYDAGYSLQPREGVPTIPRWEDTVTIDGTTIVTNRSVVLDLGAAGKGYLVDLLAGVLAEDGIESYVIDGSGDLMHRGPQTFRVGLENPADPRTVVGVANLGNGALCASASNRRRWGDGLHHIIDPATGAPSDRILATWVVAASAMVADGLATALFFTEASALAPHFEFSYVLMPAAGGIEHSTNFDGELFT